METKPSSSSRPWWVVRLLLIALAYVGLAKSSWVFIFQPEIVASFWPPSGFFLGVLCLSPRRRWPWLVLALFSANAAASLVSGYPLLVCLGFATANTVEGLGAAWVLTLLLDGPLRMNRLRDVLLIGAAALASNMFTALVGAAVPHLGFGAPYWVAWRVWWIADVVGMLLVSPVMVSWMTERPWLTLTPRRAVEGVALLGSLAVVACYVFGVFGFFGSPATAHGTTGFLVTLPYATFPFLLWAAVRFGPPGASLASLVLGVISVWSTRQGLGPFAIASNVTSAQVLLVQAFVSVAALSSLMLAAVIEERREAEKNLRRAHDGLETMVRERTKELSDTNAALQKEISEHARAERELHRTNSDLARSNSDLEQFAYVASHDLQEPLRAVVGTVQLLQRRYQGQMDAKADELIGHAVDGALRMKSLINDLLVYSRVGSPNRTNSPTDLALTVQEVLGNLATAIQESGAEVTVRGMPIVSADPTQMAQLFQNLIGNAIKFRGERRPEIRIEAEPAQAAVKITVRDNGIGIEPQYFDRIFGVFQRLHTRTAYPGTGIGLAICKKIVEHHGGSIWVEAPPGGGTAFLFTLPVTPATPIPTAG